MFDKKFRTPAPRLHFFAVVLVLATLVVVACSSGPEYPDNPAVRLDGHPPQNNPRLLIDCLILEDTANLRVMAGSDAAADSGPWKVIVNGWIHESDWYYNDASGYEGGNVREFQESPREMLNRIINSDKLAFRIIMEREYTFDLGLDGYIQEQLRETFPEECYIPAT